MTLSDTQAPTIKMINPDPYSGHITVMTESGLKTVRAGQQNFVGALTAYKAQDWVKFYASLSPGDAINSQYSGSGVTVENDRIMYQGEEVHGTIVDRILSFLHEGLDCKPMVKFLENLMLNPSRVARTELYDFLENKGLPIDEDGYVVGFKKVRDDYKDWYSNTTTNTPGAIIEMLRRNVDDDRTRECSYGFNGGLALGN